MQELFSYNPETGDVIRLSNNKVIRSLHHSGYYKTMVNKKNIIVHRLAWYLHYGTWPAKHLDHIDGDRLNNKISNLREVTVRENATNKPEHRSGKLPGCSYRPLGSSWQAQIKVAGKSAHLGNFKTELEAHNAYVEALRRVS